ncbi:hypothetical protein BU15DRAFT_44349 [Melanogaster broomeanus]|nr:hypothetical protein BU15DRAFT_44349 [Melanogaster broomeanus]
MTSAAAAHTISLVPESLYICTVPLMSGKFHWSLIHINEAGVTTRHHWAAPISNPRGRETYVEQSLSKGPLSASRTSGGKSWDISKFPTVNLTRLVSCELRALGCFTPSYATAEENRKHGISCRTWLTLVLQRLGLSNQRATEIENAVTARSETCEATYLTSVLHNTLYDVVIQDV